MNLLITCPFGLWSLLANELKKIWLTPRDTFQTGTFLTTDMYNMMRINFWSRLANKVFIELASGEAKDFNQLFNLIKWSAYGQYLSNTKLSLKIQTKNSMLSASRAIQSVAHKALLESIANFWKEESFTTELLLSIENNKAHLYLNSSWTALYQRGYKTQAWEAPIKENLAVALLLLANRKFKSPLIDPFCWSGTIAIEGALLAKNIAPWSRRNFAFEKFKNFEAWTFEKNQARCQSVNLQKQIYNLCLGYRHSNDKYCTKQCKTCKYRRYHNFSAKKLFNKQLSCRRKHSNHHQSSLWEKNQKSEFREHIYEIKRYFWVKYLLRMDQHLFY